MASIKKYNPKLIPVFVGWSLLWIFIQWNVLLKFGVTEAEAIVDSYVSNILLIGFCFLVFNNMKYYLPRHEKYWYIFAVSLVLSCCWLLLLRVILWFVFKADEHYMLTLHQSSTVRFGFAFLMIGCMSTVSLLWHSQKEAERISDQQKEIQQLAKDAELFKLRQQLQPHFLFNSLNSISALTGTQPEKARHMIQQLSDFLRGTLKKEEQQWSSFEEELQYLQLYLDIEKVRFGYRLQTHIDLDEETKQMKLPALLLQPLVENAIKFGLYDTIGEVMISIQAKKTDEGLLVTIQNPYDEETSQPLQGTGFGLASIKRRLFLLFARQDLLQTKTANSHFITTIIIPQII